MPGPPGPSARPPRGPGSTCRSRRARPPSAHPRSGTAPAPGPPPAPPRDPQTNPRHRLRPPAPPTTVPRDPSPVPQQTAAPLPGTSPGPGPGRGTVTGIPRLIVVSAAASQDPPPTSAPTPRSTSDTASSPGSNPGTDPDTLYPPPVPPRDQDRDPALQDSLPYWHRQLCTAPGTAQASRDPFLAPLQVLGWGHGTDTVIPGLTLYRHQHPRTHSQYFLEPQCRPPPPVPQRNFGTGPWHCLDPLVPSLGLIPLP
ncbi:PREDICTED: vegetative cell wall protein gp1-like [Sturnus vulgaris]|uniref:vegetative cell wall protein gp1-like n=1 Tax=Sturnus vulgaris TaxID=9172 RepID=UPI00071A4054|nr:PREDICTED: vegetative cell wall protein gp1-like [Sturnus vulgaris]